MPPVRRTSIHYSPAHDTICLCLGLVVLQRNYLEVYKYDKWTGKNLPDFEEGQEFMPSVCELRDGETTSPSLLTEADLVTLMDKNGIGIATPLLLLCYTDNPYY